MLNKSRWICFWGVCVCVLWCEGVLWCVWYVSKQKKKKKKKNGPECIQGDNLHALLQHTLQIISGKKVSCHGPINGTGSRCMYLLLSLSSPSLCIMVSMSVSEVGSKLSSQRSTVYPTPLACPGSALQHQLLFSSVFYSSKYNK